MSLVNWLNASKDLVATITAALAIILTLATAVLQRSQQKRQAYREIYNTLMSDDLHRGRWLVNSIEDELKCEEALKKDRALILRTLGTFDNLALYARKRVVLRRWVLRIWHHPLKQMESGANIIWKVELKRIDRDKRLKEGLHLRPWPDLWWLFRKANGYVSTLPCCTEEDSRGPQIRRWIQLKREVRRKSSHGALGKVRENGG